MAEPVRLQRYLAAAGVAARRKSEELITAGRVTVNGAIVTVLGTKIDPEHDAVEVDGQAVVALDHFYVLFNKPKGCITAVTDDRGRPTVMDYLPNLPVPVKPVGRLDFYSEGVLLLTNDGELAALLLAPASHVPKTYHVKVHGQLERADLAALRSGITLDDGTTTLPAEVEILPGESKHTWLGITIHEGKHRQIHRMIEALGHQVDKLQRVAFANLTFHELRVGDARELTQPELNELRDSVGLDRSAIARGRWHSRREETDIPRRARAKTRAEEEEAAESGAAPSKEYSAANPVPPVGSDASDVPGPRGPAAERGPGAPDRARSGRGQQGASARRDDGRGAAHGTAAGPRGEGDREATVGKAAGRRGEGSRRPAHSGAPGARGARDRGAMAGKAAGRRGEGKRRPAYSGAAGRGEGNRRSGYSGAAGPRGEGSRRSGYSGAAGPRGEGSRRAAYRGSGARDAVPGSGQPRPTRAAAVGSRRSPGGGPDTPARGGFGPRVPRRGRPPK
jgi:23S rRNA pseudouridine2605 synthase